MSCILPELFQASIAFYEVAEDRAASPSVGALFVDIRQIHSEICDDLLRHSDDNAKVAPIPDLDDASRDDDQLILSGFQALRASICELDAGDLTADLRLLEQALIFKLAAAAWTSSVPLRQQALMLHAKSLRNVLKSIDFIERNKIADAEWCLYDSV